MAHCDEVTRMDFGSPAPARSLGSVVPIFSLVCTRCVSLSVCSSLKQTQQALSSPPVTALPPDWIRVPQRVYNHGTKQWDFRPSEPVFFSTGGRPGVNLRDALRKKFNDLDGQDDPVLQDSAGAISCRLLVGSLR